MTTVTLAGYNQNLTDTATVVAALWANGFVPVEGLAGVTRGDTHQQIVFAGYTGEVTMNLFDQRVIGLRYQGLEGFDWAIGDVADAEGLDLYQRAAAKGRAGFTDDELQRFSVGTF